MQKIIEFLLNKTPLFYWTQSLWRDEAISYWMSKDGLWDVMKRASGDFHTPLYYLFLNLWLKLFGQNEVILRSFSLLTFFLTVYVSYLIAQLVFKKKSLLPYFIAVLTLTSPMLIYYAFELRMYSLFALLAALSTYFFIRKKLWPYVISVAAGLYTQPYMLFVLIYQNADLLLQKKYRELVKNNLLVFLLFLPWVPTLLHQLRQSGPMWIWPVDTNLIMSVLGNLYTGFEGTPPTLWFYMKWLSLIIFLISAVVFIKRRQNRYFPHFLLLVYLPLILVLGISFIKPIYVLRYVIFVTMGEIFLITAFISLLKNKLRQKVVFGLFLIANIYLTSYMVPHHTKVNIRRTFEEIIPRLNPGDEVYAQTPLVYYESVYYTPQQFPVYLWNPNKITPPRFVGSVGMPESVWVAAYPQFPNRAFVVQEDASYQIQSRL